eukprot:12334668-Ditylum_brightwellii.AAC.1
MLQRKPKKLISGVLGMPVESLYTILQLQLENIGWPPSDVCIFEDGMQDFGLCKEFSWSNAMPLFWKMTMQMHYIIKCKRPVEHGMNEHGTAPKGDSLDGAFSYTILMVSPDTTVEKVLGFQLAVLDIALGFEDAIIIAVVFDVDVKTFCKMFKVMFGAQH